MLLNQSVSARQAVLACASLAGLLSLGGCSLFHHGSHAAATPEPATAAAAGAPEAATETTGSEPQQTVTDNLPAENDTEGATTVISDAGGAVKAGAPRSYVVRRGDTLWGIANMFLKDPWLWPEIWYINPDISNPHRIYPGDTIRLALGGNGRVALQVVRGQVQGGPGTRLEPLLRSSPLEGPIATIPYSAIAAFLSRPGVLTSEEVHAAPYVLGLADNHQVAGAGHDVYVKKLAGDSGARFSVMHVDEPLKDPDSGHKYGYLAIYAGTAQLTAPGRIAKMTLTDSARETLQGDVLIANQESLTTDFAPHVPTQPVSGRVMAVVDNVLLAGQFEIAALNRGSKDGLDRGTVLAVDQVGEPVADECAHVDGSSTCWWHSTEKLPSERAGTLLVFKTYEHMSYALILSEVAPIHIKDHVRSP